MIKINDDGEIFINGQSISELTSGLTSGNSSSTKRTIVIKNGEVIQNDFESTSNMENMENFHSDFIEQMNSAFQPSKKTKKVKCSYCDSVYKSSKEKCPNCGATDILV